MCILRSTSGMNFAVVLVLKQFIAGLWLSEKIDGASEEADARAVSTDDGEDDESTVDDDEEEDEDEDFVKEFENGETSQLSLICCTYRNSGLFEFFDL